MLAIFQILWQSAWCIADLIFAVWFLRVIYLPMIHANQLPRLFQIFSKSVILVLFPEEHQKIFPQPTPPEQDTSDAANRTA
jgi:hypothetical protein